MDFTDASPFDITAASADIRHGILCSLILGALGIAVAAGGYAYDQSVDSGRAVESVKSSSPA